MSDNRCRYGTGENKSIILHKKVQMGWETFSERIMYYMELNKNGADGDNNLKT